MAANIPPYSFNCKADSFVCMYCSSKPEYLWYQELSVSYTEHKGEAELQIPTGLISPAFSRSLSTGFKEKKKNLQILLTF